MLICVVLATTMLRGKPVGTFSGTVKRRALPMVAEPHQSNPWQSFKSKTMILAHFFVPHVSTKAAFFDSKKLVLRGYAFCHALQTFKISR